LFRRSHTCTRREKREGEKEIARGGGDGEKEISISSLLVAVRPLDPLYESSTAEPFEERKSPRQKEEERE
jgi:hypothetical protein